MDFLLEPIDEDALLAAVARALARDAEARGAGRAGGARGAGRGPLAARARGVRAGGAGGLNKQIAAELGISESAVRLYRAEGKQKLGVTSVAELPRLFARLGGGVAEG